MTYVRTLHRLAGAGLVLCLLLTAGCGSEPKKYRVYGVVKYKGQPVKFGSISFRADNGATGGGQITDGKYDIPAVGGLAPGNYRVAIYYPDPKAPKPRDDQPPGEVAPAKDLLPAEYNDQTKLTAEVKAQDNEVNFDLK